MPPAWRIRAAANVLAAEPSDGPDAEWPAPIPPDPESRGLFRLSEIRSRPVTWLWRGRIPCGKLTILDGDPGLGKSTLMLDLAARLTTGRALPDDPTPPDAPHTVALLSAEDGAADTIRPRLEAAGGDLDRVLVLGHLPADCGAALLQLPRHVWFVRELVERVSPSLLIVDPFVAYLGPEINPHSDQAVRQALAPLVQLAESTAIAIVVIRHLSKRAARNPLYRGGGSIGLIGAARSGLLVAPDPDDPSATRRILASTKANLGPPPPSLAYRLVPAANGVAVVAWDGPSHQTAASLLSELEQAAPGRVLDEAKTVLATILADGPLPAALVHRQALQAGISRSSLLRAKAALGVRSRKRGGTQSFEQLWVWSLPDQP